MNIINRMGPKINPFGKQRSIFTTVIDSEIAEVLVCWYVPFTKI